MRVMAAFARPGHSTIRTPRDQRAADRPHGAARRKGDAGWPWNRDKEPWKRDKNPRTRAPHNPASRDQDDPWRAKHKAFDHFNVEE